MGHAAPIMRSIAASRPSTGSQRQRTLVLRMATEAEPTKSAIPNENKLKAYVFISTRRRTDESSISLLSAEIARVPKARDPAAPSATIITPPITVSQDQMGGQPSPEPRTQRSDTTYGRKNRTKPIPVM